MKIEADRDLILKSITMVDSFIPSRSVNAILANCYFRVYSDKLLIAATDNELGIKTVLKASSNAEKTFTVNGTRLAGLIKEMPSGAIIIDIDDSYKMDVKTKSGVIKGDFTLIGTPGDNYPEIPDFYEEGAVEIKQAELKEMIRKVIYAAATDTIRPAFNGVYFVSESRESLTLVATNSQRMSIITRDLKNEIDLDEGVIIPLKAMHELYRLLGLDGTCSFSMQDNRCFFKIDKTQFVTRVVDHKYPNYKQIVPVNQDFSVYVSRIKLLESLRRAMIFTKPPIYNSIICTFFKDQLTIRVSASDLGECIEEIGIESNIENMMSIGINVQYIYDAIKEMDSDKVMIGITEEMKAVKLMPDNDSDYITIIMPVKVRSQDID